VLHSLSFNGLLWKRKCHYQASLTSVPSLHQWWKVKHAHLSVSHITVHRCCRHFLWRKVYFQYLCKVVTGVRRWKLGHSKSPDFNMCNYYYDYFV